MKSFIRSFAVISVAALAVALVAQVTNGKAAQFSDKQKKALTRKNFQVLVPTYIPAGFTLESAELTKEKQDVMVCQVMVYKNTKSKAELVVQMASDGIGDPFFILPNGDTVEATGTLKCKSPIFGRFDLDFVKNDKLRMFHTTWYELKGKQFPDYVLVMEDGVEASEGKKFAESLRWLAP